MSFSSALAPSAMEILVLVVPAVAALLFLALTYVVIRLAVRHGVLDAGRVTDRASAAHRARRVESAAAESTTAPARTSTPKAAATTPVARVSAATAPASSKASKA